MALFPVFWTGVRRAFPIITISCPLTYPRLSPYFGQAGWFTYYHPEKLPSAIERYRKEIVRVTGVLDSVLAERTWLVGDKLSAADLAFIVYVRMCFLSSTWMLTCLAHCAGGTTRRGSALSRAGRASTWTTSQTLSDGTMR